MMCERPQRAAWIADGSNERYVFLSSWIDVRKLRGDGDGRLMPGGHLVYRF